MKSPEIVNIIDIGDKEYEFDTLSDERKEEISLLIQDRIMEAAGYRRKSP